MKKTIKILAMLLAVLFTVPQTWGARKRSADEKPIITFRSNAYKEVGAENSFGLVLGATETDYYDVDYGFGLQEMEVEPWRLENGEIKGTYMSVRVNEEGLIRVYGDASKIDFIRLEGGYITEVDMEQCVNLEVLDLGHNSLQKLDLTPFTNLYAIYLSDNPFTAETPLKVGAPKNRLAILEIDIVEHLDQSFNLSDYPAMQAFDAYHNLDLYNVDPTGCPELLTMSLELTNVSSLDVSKNPKLLSLNISETRIAEIDLSNNPLLTTLMAEHASGFINTGYYLKSVDLSKLPALQVLYLGGNRLASLDLSKNPALTNINLRKNNLTSLDLSKNKNLYSVMLNFNNMDFATLPAPQDTWGEYFYQQNEIPVSKSIGVGQTLDLSSRVLREGTSTEGYVFVKDLTGNDTLLDPEYYTYADGKITFNKIPTDSVYAKYSNDLLSEYMLSTTPFMVKAIEDLGKPSGVISFVPAVKTTITGYQKVGMYGATPENPKKFMVDFGDGILKEFTATTSDLPEFPNLEGEFNPLEMVTIYVPEGESITAYGIPGGEYESVDLRGAPELRTLVINNTELKDIDLRYNRCLERLNLDNNKLETLDLTGLYPNWEKYVLSDLSAAGNGLKECTVVARTQMRNIDLSGNALTEFDLVNYDGLQTVDLSNNSLEGVVSLVYLGASKSIDLSGNNITSLKYDAFTDLQNFDISDNNLTLETLPYQPDASVYTYAPQKNLQILKSAPSVNLSDQNRIIDGQGTAFVWKKADGTPLVEGVDINCVDGGTRFLKDDLGLVYCEMTNPAFPQFAGDKIFRTTEMTVVGAPTTLVATFTTLEDAFDGEVVFASKEGSTAVYIDWRGDGTEYLPYEAVKTGLAPVDYTGIRTFKNAKVKVYTYEQPEDITVFGVYGVPMAEFDGRPLTGLISLSLENDGLTAANMKLPDAGIVELNLAGNRLTEYPYFEKYPDMIMLNLNGNELESFDASPLGKLKNLYLADNKLGSITLNNPLLWELLLDRNNLSTIDVSRAKKLEQVSLAENKFENLDLSPLRGSLRVLNVVSNYLTFSTLPVPSNFPRLTGYSYANQAPVEAVVSDDFMTYDLSSQALINNIYQTEYTWFLGAPVYDSDEGTLSGETLILDDEYTLENGITTFNYKFDDDVYCVMTNTLFPRTYLITPGYRVGYDMSGVEEIADGEEALIDVFTISGMMVKRQVNRAEALSDLAPGLYIVGGKKVMIR